MDLAATARAIEVETSALIATLPELPADRLAAVHAEVLALAGGATGAIATTATTLAAVIAVYQDGRAVLEGWAVVASAAHTLTRALAAPAGADAALAAVRFELETLLPPRVAPAPRPGAPDVPLTSLVRRT